MWGKCVAHAAAAVWRDALAECARQVRLIELSDLGAMSLITGFHQLLYR